MAFRRSDLQEAFFVPCAHGFRVYGYGTVDPLEEVLTEGYFAAAGGQLRPGELIYVSTLPRPGDRDGRDSRRTALVMVRGGGRGADSVRLVQDFGRPTDGGAAGVAPAGPARVPPAPVKRGRGRPPGSRNRKPA